ncbi:MAG TPA: SH3 domain-containing protein [Leptospiraceae bacterium]|nr:SH3 domain-containing protein [Leptospiraceae bacterium]HMW08702.1 SH3 domain-containing protein [Leptospiraceae bacterium]HMX35132.1 SH3 domain-containing protein [Leptospiraceae bacterium]HMY34416.1 SH3 domain-containing protein [Leptospiraceae bacterium]HMZ66847.1 SH3 domain-containing protein [Leptospiraceae bacterium]
MVRDKPSQKGNEIGIFSKNTKVTLLEKTEVIEKIGNFIAEWAMVKNEKVKGYVYGAHLAGNKSLTLCSWDKKKLYIHLYSGKKIKMDSEYYAKEVDAKIYSQCEYDEFFKGILIQSGGYEGESYQLYDLNTGKDYDICNSEYILSPSKKFVLFFSDDLEANYNKNGIEIFNNQYPLQKLLNYDFTDSKPCNPKWISDSKLKIKTCDTNGKEIGEKIFIHKNNKWQELRN